MLEYVNVPATGVFLFKNRPFSCRSSRKAGFISLEFIVWRYFNITIFRVSLNPSNSKR